MEKEIVKHEFPTNEKLIGFLDIMGIGKHMTDKEKDLFLEISKTFGLNPFKREIHPSKYTKDGPFTIVVGYESYIKRAERSGQLDGWSCTTEGKIEDGSLKAILTIHRKDRKFPFIHEVYYSEYVKEVEIEETDQKTGHTKKTGKFRPTKFWKMGITMIKKVCMSQGFRLCFSDELGGMPYTAEELPEIVDTTATVVESVKTQPQPTPQPIIDNVTHDINGLKKHSETLQDLNTTWNRIDLPTQSRPAVIDQYTSLIVGFINDSESKATLKLVYNSLSKEFQDNENLKSIFKAKELTFKTVK